MFVSNRPELQNHTINIGFSAANGNSKCGSVEEMDSDRVREKERSGKCHQNGNSFITQSKHVQKCLRSKPPYEALTIFSHRPQNLIWTCHLPIIISFHSLDTYIWVHFSAFRTNNNAYIRCNWHRHNCNRSDSRHIFWWIIWIFTLQENGNFMWKHRATSTHYKSVWLWNI